MINEEITKMHERVWENFEQAFNTKATVTKEEVIDVLKAHPYNLGFMAYFMDSFSDNFSKDSCEVVCQIVENLRNLIELLLPLASVPMFAGDNSFFELRDYLFDCEKIYELMQLSVIQFALDDIVEALGGEL